MRIVYALSCRSTYKLNFSTIPLCPNAPGKRVVIDYNGCMTRREFPRQRRNSYGHLTKNSDKTYCGLKFNSLLSFSAKILIHNTIIAVVRHARD